MYPPSFFLARRPFYNGRRYYLTIRANERSRVSWEKNKIDRTQRKTTPACIIFITRWKCFRNNNRIRFYSPPPLFNVCKVVVKQESLLFLFIRRIHNSERGGEITKGRESGFNYANAITCFSCQRNFLRSSIVKLGSQLVFDRLVGSKKKRERERGGGKDQGSSPSTFTKPLRKLFPIPWSLLRVYPIVASCNTARPSFRETDLSIPPVLLFPPSLW